MASIKCAHCKGCHGSVDRVRLCAMQEQDMIAEAKVQADIASYEEWCAEQDYLAEYRAEVGHYPYPADAEFDAQDAAEGDCVHGLSLWLCADPINHYPADNTMDCF